MRLPGGATRRLAGVDAARGLALVGMAATHVFPTFTPDGEVHPAYVVAAGRAAALFAVLAGVGLALLARGVGPLRRARVAVAVRAVLLLWLGLALGTLDSPPLVILAYYALLFLVAIPLLGLGIKALAALAVVWAVGSPVLSHLLRSTVLEAAAVEEPGGLGLPVTLAVTGIYPVLTWTTYLLAGLAVGRLPLRSRAVAIALLVGGTLLAAGSRLLSSLLLAAAGGEGRLLAETPGLSPVELDRALDAGMFGVTPTSDPAWLLVAAPHSGATLDLVGTTGSALAVLGGCLLLSRVVGSLLMPFAAAGSMSLTLYTAHVVALRREGGLLLDDPLQLWLVHVGVGLLFAVVWSRLFGRGPLEAPYVWLSRRIAGAGVREVGLPVRS